MNIYRLLQMNGGTFPTGGFSQSWGLETYVSDGTVNDAISFKAFLDTYLLSCVGKCEGPIICSVYRAADRGATDEIKELEQLSNASKVTKESREAALRMGKAFIRIMDDIIRDHESPDMYGEFQGFLDIIGTKEISYPVAYGFICSMLGLPLHEVIEAYVYSAANTLVQSGVKLIPLGNTEAQKILFEESDVMDSAVRLSLETDLDDITNFCPGIDIASIRHETLPVRLYMS